MQLFKGTQRDYGLRMTRDGVRLDRLDQGQGRREEERVKHFAIQESWGWSKYLKHAARKSDLPKAGNHRDKNCSISEHVTEGHCILLRAAAVRGQCWTAERGVLAERSRHEFAGWTPNYRSRSAATQASPS